MRKIANTLLIFVMCFILVGCGKDDKSSNSNVEKEDESIKLKMAMTQTASLINAVKYEYMAILSQGKDFPIGVEQDATKLDLEEKPTSGTYIVSLDNGYVEVSANGLVFGNYICDYDMNKGVDCKKRD